MKTFQQWRDLASWAFAWQAGQEAERDEVAVICHHAEQSGGAISAWHANAVRMGRRCNCALCKHDDAAIFA
jgi:hypothetical protein